MKNKNSEIKRYNKLIHKLTFAFLFTIIVLGALMTAVLFILNRNVIKFNRNGFSIFWTLAGYFICLILASGISYYAVWNIFKPLRKISDAIKSISDGNYDTRIEYKGKIAELADAVDNFNQMAVELSSVEMMRNDFISNISHEFKTPLSSLNGYLTLLQDSTLSENEKNEYISKAVFSMKNLNDLTENILSLSKIEHQAELPAAETYRLDEQLREAVLILEPNWEKKNISFDINLPEIVYTGQKSLLFRVWTNIIGNAVKFSFNGGSITIRLEESDHHYKIYISDEGIGMTEEEQEHIFDKFYQADPSRKSQGNGLGLALCKEIVSKCSGKIYVTSKPNDGSVFLVSLRKTAK